MKKLLFLFILMLSPMMASAQTVNTQEYYPEGTKWTEIRLDTLKYDSWYSKVGDEWVPNFETIEYYVKGEYVEKEWDDSNIFKKVYTNGPEWTDSLTFLIQESDLYGHNSVMVSVLSHWYDDEDYSSFPAETYQFDWNIGKGIYYQDIMQEQTTYIVRYRFYYGIIDEIKEGDFGGVRPLKYADLDGKAPECGKYDNPQKCDTNGGCIIQGIGITEWNDGECLFGPPRPYFALHMFGRDYYPERHYRSMLVHFERNGEVLYDVWPKKEVTYRPMIEDNKEWTMVYLGAVGPEYQHTFSYEQIKLGSTLEVDGMTFKQIVSSSWWNDQDGPSNWTETDEYLGEADGKMYLYNKKSQNTVQIMDFTLQVGDTYRQMQMGDPNDYMDFVVTAVTDTVIATSSDKSPRKCLYLSRPGSTNIDDVWIEGIGSLVGGVRGGYEQLMGGAIPMLRTCQQDGQTLYEAYHPFLKEGKTWNCQEYYCNGWIGEESTTDVSYVINGTTEIDGKTYYKMYRKSEDENKYYCALREEDRKVWMNRGHEDFLLYDFNMSVGDSYMPNEFGYNYQLTDIKTMRFQYDQLLNVLYYDISEHYDVTAPANHIASAPIIEGVGCELGWNITNLYEPQPANGIIQRENFLSCYEDGKCIFTIDDFNNLTNSEPDIAYRPMIEDGKVWKVGTIPSSPESPVQIVDYYYFDGETIIDGKTCKQMWCQRFVSPDYPDYSALTQTPSLSKAGAWYEEDKKVYVCREGTQGMEMLYDFSLEANDTLILNDYQPYYTVGPKQTGGLKGFKGVYRDIMLCGQDIYITTWLEGIGGIDGPLRNVYPETESDPQFLMACTVGDEVIYLNDEYEDGATPEGLGIFKKRFDFTHTTKLQPKTPRRSDEEQSLYGEYNSKLLGINLDPLDDTYQVRIFNESGQAVYEKTVNAGTIVGLSIDISDYAKGCYTVTVENSNELFTGEFETETTGIEETIYNKVEAKTDIYNLQGQRLSSPQKGLNIVNGKKVYVK